VRTRLHEKRVDPAWSLAHVRLRSIEDSRRPLDGWAYGKSAARPVGASLRSGREAVWLPLAGAAERSQPRSGVTKRSRGLSPGRWSGRGEAQRLVKEAAWVHRAFGAQLERRGTLRPSRVDGAARLPSTT
jgi:hypothetical protein